MIRGRLYFQVMVLTVVPLLVALAVILLYSREMVAEGRLAGEREVAETNRHLQFELGNNVAQVGQLAMLLARGREVAQGLAERNTMLLQAWGNRLMIAGLANEVYFVSPDNIVIARGHDDTNFNDPYKGALHDENVRGGKVARIEYADGRIFVAARAPILQFDVKPVGSVVVLREISPLMLAGMGSNPAVSVELKPQALPANADRNEGDGTIVRAFELSPDLTSGSDIHLLLRRNPTLQDERLQNLGIVMLVIGVLSLTLLPVSIAFIVYRLLRPVRLLNSRLLEFASMRKNTDKLVRDVEALADGRNELSGIAGSVAVALRAIQEMQKDLVQAEKLASLGAMVAGVTHEINTPIGNSRVLASTLREHAEELAAEIAAGRLRRSSLDKFLVDCGEAMRIIESGLGRTVEIIESFKHVAVDQAGGQRRIFRLHETVTDLLRMLHPVLKKLPIEVIDDVPIAIDMDSFPGALGQVLSNLVQNAAIHGLDGMAKGHIRIAARELEGSRVQITVSDNGVGIPPENLAHIFEEFFTTKRGAGGSGLGLHISRQLVTGMLGGTITVQSEPGKGSTFTIDLPAVAPQDPGKGGGDRPKSAEVSGKGVRSDGGPGSFARQVPIGRMAPNRA